MTLYKGSQKIAPIVKVGITPSGDLGITENGTYDVTNYANAVVNVPNSGGVVDSNFEALKTAIDNCTFDDISWRNGKPSNPASSYPNLIGTSFLDTVSKIYITYGNAQNYKIPSDATVTEETSSRIRIDFNSEKWIIYPKSTGVLEAWLRIDYNVGDGAITSAALTGVAIKNMTSSTRTITLTSLIVDPCINVRNFYINGDVAFNDTNVQSLLKILPYLGDNDLFFDNATSLTKNSTITADYFLWTPSSSASTAVYSPAGTLFYWDSFPFVLDLTAGASYNNKTYYLENLRCNTMSGIKNIRIILPSNCNVDLQQFTTQSVTNASIILSAESLDFMAQNAPTVSSKTLTLNYMTQYLIPNYSTFLSTMQAKGWTVN